MTSLAFLSDGPIVQMNPFLPWMLRLSVFSKTTGNLLRTSPPIFDHIGMLNETQLLGPISDSLRTFLETSESCS